MTFTVNMYPNLVFIFKHSIFSPPIHLVLLFVRVNEILIFVYQFERFVMCSITFLAIDWWRKNMNRKIIESEYMSTRTFGCRIHVSSCLRSWFKSWLYTNLKISVEFCDFEDFSMVWILHLNKVYHMQSDKLPQEKKWLLDINEK